MEDYQKVHSDTGKMLEGKTDEFSYRISERKPVKIIRFLLTQSRMEHIRQNTPMKLTKLPAPHWDLVTYTRAWDTSEAYWCEVRVPHHQNVPDEQMLDTFLIYTANLASSLLGTDADIRLEIIEGVYCHANYYPIEQPKQNQPDTPS